MRSRDIRFSRQNVTVAHASARGNVTRNAGDFTRGSQLVTHEFLMTFAGIKVPLLAWLGVFIVVMNITLYLQMAEHEIQLVLMKAMAGALTWIGFDSGRMMDLTLPTGMVQSISAGDIPYHPAIAHAWAKAVRCLLGSMFISAFIAAPVTVWFVRFSKNRGQAILEERHERGAMLVSAARLLEEIRRHNSKQLASDCARIKPPRTVAQVKAMKPAERKVLGLHRPYTIAGIPFPWRLEQSHSILIGTTGSGKTTQLRSLVKEMRDRGQRAVIFDLTGAFVEAFYNEETDTILNPMDTRCPAWSIFNDCENYADFLSAAEALIPTDGNREMFWENAARTLFVEMCMVLKREGNTTNRDIADRLMTARLKDVHENLAKTVAGPLTSTDAARMAESIRSTFNTNAHVLRFLPDEGTPFSINDWMAGKFKPGSIMFITSTHTDLVLNRPMLTLWMNLAVNSLMRLPRTRELRTWFLFDEVHALHRLPAIENGLQTARGFGGAFVLGIHSFEKLAETYGQQGAVNLAALARTKLMLATAEMETAQKCTDFIGNREVRQMDEAYSYGYNNTRDASTLTPRKAVEPLVIPDDITNLPSMHGFVKFPDGFPAARIQLRWQDYPERATAFLRKKDPESVNPSNDGIPPRPKQPEDEGTGITQTVPEERDPTAPKTQQERDAEAAAIKQHPTKLTVVGKDDAKPEPEQKLADKEAAKGAGSVESKAVESPALRRSGSIRDTLEDRDGAKGKDAPVQANGRDAKSDRIEREATEDNQESQIERETRDGAGIDEEARRDDNDRGIGDD